MTKGFFFPNVFRRADKHVDRILLHKTPRCPSSSLCHVQNSCVKSTEQNSTTVASMMSSLQSVSHTELTVMSTDRNLPQESPRRPFLQSVSHIELTAMSTDMNLPQESPRHQDVPSSSLCHIQRLQSRLQTGIYHKDLQDSKTSLPPVCVTYRAYSHVYRQEFTTRISKTPRRHFLQFGSRTELESLET